MKKFRPALVFSFLGIATFASLVGTVSGTLAWYAYNTRTTLSYSGTSVENSIQLQIGLACDAQMPHNDSDPDNVAFWSTMVEEEGVEPGTYFYFAPLGYGIDSQIINAYLKVHGFATKELIPTTSGYYDPEVHDDCILKDAPTTEHHNTDSATDTANYLQLPFIFRASKSKTAAEYVANQELWLTDAKGAASSQNDGNIYKAMRIYFDRDDSNYDTDFIVNPDADSDGETKVAGLLDLSCDGYYDFDENGEVFYGEWDETQLADPSTKLSDSGYVAPVGGNPVYHFNYDNSIANPDDPYNTKYADTFRSRHNPGTKYYDYDAFNTIPYRTAKYKCLESVKPERNQQSGQLTNKDELHPTSVCKTAGAEGKYVGRVDVRIWLEGWDFAVIDEEQFHSFDLGLTFEINRVGLDS